MKTTTFKIKTINEVALVQLKKKNKTKQKTNTDRTSPGVPRAGDGAPRAPQSHRRTSNFLPVGAVTHLPIYSCKFLNFLQNSRTETRAIRCNNIGRTSIWKWLDTVFQGQYLWSFFEHRLRHHKQTFGKIATTVVLDKDENLLRSGLLLYLQQHFSLGTVLPKSFTEAFSSNSRLDVREIKTESVRALRRYFGIKFLSLEIR